YIGYNGASQRYSGVDSTQNGGLIGGTVTMYKGNFFNATTVSVGANVAQNQTMYGKDDFAMLLSGIGNKTGYNFEFKEGKLILQPSMLMSYTFVNTFDYTNAAGVRIDNKPLHALQLAPGVKVIGNLKNGWQPYASVSMVWNLMGESDATANGVKLPEMSIKPYVQYGVGVQKRIKDHFTAYGQAMIQNGGRNGISLTGGFRWALGKNKDQKVEKVRNDKVSYTSGKKILKQMTPEQRMALGGGKYMNTSRTAKAGSLRQY
ncbi:autotransporter outer membrane beta-barrel domain-containing protein, partial [bacterium]|nr:autotransporter outer membrane beta-barrel domain-containing protein [bacterium]